VSQALRSDMKVSATRRSTNSLRFEIQSQKMKSKIKISAHVSQALGSNINNRLRFEIQLQRIKEKIKISTHVSQALSFDLKVSATRPSTNSLRFEAQSQRMKRKIKISTHVTQALGSHMNKQLEV
jgi:hypothetical protein